jgi:hypothetical protein
MEAPMATHLPHIPLLIGGKLVESKTTQWRK